MPITTTDKPFLVEQATEARWLVAATMFGGWLGSRAHQPAVGRDDRTARSVRIVNRWRQSHKPIGGAKR